MNRTPRYQRRILIATLVAGSTTTLGIVIQEVHRRPVKIVPEFKDAINHSTNSILLLVNRDGHILWTVVEPNA